MAQLDTRPEQPFRGRATIRDIADLAGVSIATVSRVLNDRPDVAAGTRETVLQVVREHGFTTNRGARGLSSGRTGMIGLTLPLVADAYFGPMLSGAADARHDRRRDPDAPRGVRRRAALGATAGLPIRGRRSARAAARRHPVRGRDARRRC